LVARATGASLPLLAKMAKNFRVAHRKGNIPFWEVEGKGISHWRFSFFFFLYVTGGLDRSGDGFYVRLFVLCVRPKKTRKKENKNNLY
jgi:hypothetical protein